LTVTIAAAGSKAKRSESIEAFCSTAATMRRCAHSP
jgi:hypothetical protein